MGNCILAIRGGVVVQNTSAWRNTSGKDDTTKFRNRQVIQDPKCFSTSWLSQSRDAAQTLGVVPLTNYNCRTYNLYT